MSLFLTTHNNYLQHRMRPIIVQNRKIRSGVSNQFDFAVNHDFSSSRRAHFSKPASCWHAHDCPMDIDKPLLSAEVSLHSHGNALAGSPSNTRGTPSRAWYFLSAVQPSRSQSVQERKPTAYRWSLQGVCSMSRTKTKVKVF